MKEKSQYVKEYGKNKKRIINLDFLDDFKNVDVLYKLAEFGNPLAFSMPSILADDKTADMSFSGIETHGSKLFYETSDPLSGISPLRAVKPRRKLSLSQIINLASSLEFSLSSMLLKSYKKALLLCKEDKPRFIGMINLDNFGQKYIKSRFSTPVIKEEAAMIANMAWHLVRENEACDLSHDMWSDYEEVFEILPVGNYCSDVKDNKQSRLKSGLADRKLSQAERIKLFVERNKEWQREFDEANKII